jgi:ELWxxDGT repeat protein
MQVPNSPYAACRKGLPALMFGLSVAVAAGQLIATHEVADLNPGSAGSNPTNLTVFSDGLCFSAFTQTVGTELWRYDHTNITLVSNINDTVTDLGAGMIQGNSSNPNWLTVYNGGLYFAAYDQRRGDELWRYDGTNTQRVADINPDADDTIKSNPASSFPSELTVLGNQLFFSANNSNTKPNYELWRFDGTNATQVANIHPDSGSDFSSYPTGITAFNGYVYFMADDGTHGYELWRANVSGATLLSDINPGNESSSSYPQGFTIFANKLFFEAFNGTFGYELWATDGTNTSRITDLNPGSAGSYPTHLTVYNNALYFQATDGTNGYELWRYDGAQTTLVTNLNPTGDAFPKNLTVFQNQLFFAADDGTRGWELWKYDGTTASLVSDLNPTGDSFPEHLTVFSNYLYFTATTPATGYELWKCDGTNVFLAADINTGAGSSYPRSLTPFSSELCFSAAADGVSDYELWTQKPVSFSISGIERAGDDIVLRWTTVGGTTNIVLATDDSLGGTFTNVSDLLLIPGMDETNISFTDVGAAVGRARFYRIAQP